MSVDQFFAYLPGALFRYRVLVDCRDRSENLSVGCFDLWELSAIKIESDPAQLRKLSSWLSHEVVKPSCLLIGFGLLGLWAAWVEANLVDKGPVAGVS